MDTSMTNNSAADAPRVLFVDQAGELGGAELSLFDIIRCRPGPASTVLFNDGPFRECLEKIGADVQVLPLGKIGQVERDSGLLRAALGSSTLIVPLFKLAARARKADVVYANTQKSFVVGAVAARLAGRPIIWHLRDMLTADHFSPAMRKIAVSLANHLCAAVIANSHATADAFRQAGGTVPLHVVHNGIDPAAFDAIETADAVRWLRAELGVPEAPLVGVFSRLADWKGQHIMIDALGALPDVHAVLVGGSLFDERDYEAALRERVVQRGLTERCHFLGFRSDIPALMKAVDIVAHTSTSPEPFGRVIVEGMLAGRPVIATRAGGANEIIKDGETGLLVAPGDAKALAGAIAALLDPQSRHAGMAQRGDAAARSQFSLTACVNGVDALIAAYAKR